MATRKKKPSEGPERFNSDIAHLARAAATLRVDPRNARQHNAKNMQAIAESLRQFGQQRAIVVQPDGTIIAGNGTFRAATELLGWKRIAAITFEGDERAARAFALADNRSAELAEWDYEELTSAIAALSDDVDLVRSLGWDDDELAQIVRNVDATPEPAPPTGRIEIVEDEAPDNVDELHEKWRVEAGQLWEIGPHRVVCGDCRDPAVVARLLDGQRINVAITSPPYASQRKYDESSGFRPIAAEEFASWFAPVQENVRAHLAPDGSWFVNIKAHCEDGQRVLYVMELAIAHVRQWGWRLVDEFCWVRPAPPGRWPDRFKNGFEPVYHFAIGRPKFRPQSVGHKSDGIPVKSSVAGANKSGPNGEYWNLSSETTSGIALPSNVVEVSGVAKGTGHEAAYPVGLPAFFVQAFSDAGDVVFDPFVGSGTTIVAAHRTGRAGYGVELSPRYVAVVLERLSGLGLDPRRVT